MADGLGADFPLDVFLPEVLRKFGIAVVRYVLGQFLVQHLFFHQVEISVSEAARLAVFFVEEVTFEGRLFVNRAGAYRDEVRLATVGWKLWFASQV